jgi:hypothetical protein
LYHLTNSSVDDFVGNRTEIKAPYRVLVHHRRALARFRDNQPTVHDEEYASITAKHINVLLDFLEKTLGKQLAEEERRNHHSSGPKTVFANLWILFKPGDVVYSKLDGSWTPFVVSRCNDGTHIVDSEGHSEVFKLDCWNIVYRDGQLRRAFYTLDIPFFSGEDAVNKLPVVPLRFHEGNAKGAIFRKEVELGKATWELTKRPTYKLYDGTIVNPSSEDNYNPTSTTGYVSASPFPLKKGKRLKHGVPLPIIGRKLRFLTWDHKNVDERSRNH